MGGRAGDELRLVDQDHRRLPDTDERAARPRSASTVIGFLWKESGTTCIHLPQTHAVIKLWRALVEHVAPGARLLTETNVPHAENISYFGDGGDEAHLVYQFALPPLVLHSFVAGSTGRLSDWARGVGPVSDTATWFNFLASHDGIGLRATEGILNDPERLALVERTQAHGGRVSMASRPDGTSAVYELNLSYLDALCTPAEALLPQVLAAKALAAHSILFAFLGVRLSTTTRSSALPRTTRAWRATDINRRINREVLDADARRLARIRPRRHAVFTGMRHLLEVRRGQPAFSPFGTQEVEHSTTASSPCVVVPALPTSCCASPTSPAPPSGYPAWLRRGVRHRRRCRWLDPWGYVWLRSTDR